MTVNEEAISGEKAKNKYALLLAEKEGITYKQAYNEMLKLKWATGLSFADFYYNDMHNLDEHVRFRTAEKMVARKERGKRYAEEISEIKGVEVSEVRDEVKRLREQYQDLCSITTTVYHDYELYRKSEEEIRDVAELFSRRKDARDRFKAIYEDELEYDDQIEALEAIYNEIKDINERLLTQTLVDRFRERFAIRYPQITGDEDAAKEVVLDFLTLRIAAGYKDTDYMIYDLFPKSLADKLAFASSHEMGNVVRKINAPEARFVLDDKYGCYKKFKSYFRRDIVSIKKLKDVINNKQFFEKHESFVKKPVYSKQGSGIHVVDTKDYESIEAMGKSVLKEDGAFIAEELIKGHPTTSVFNDDSLNTLRIVTVNAGKRVPGIDENNEALKRGIILYAGSGIYCCAAFFKTGRKGSFVDNAGAGGCFTAIDLKRGISSGIATGEDGSEYTSHPDTGVSFASLKIKNRHSLISKAKKLALMIPEAGIVGWDFALNDKGKWILIEANFSPTFIGQAPAKYGIRREIHRMVFSSDAHEMV